VTALRPTDDELGIPYICVCPTAMPEPCGQCRHCLRPVVATWPPTAYSAALMAYPQVCTQQVDWTLRKATV
jgi:hypothetical protein